MHTHSTAELNKRFANTMITMKKLDLFWRHSNCRTEIKVHVAEAVLRSKLLYGLESAQLNPAVVKRLETFQLKVLRKILQMKTTFVERANTNKLVFDKANEIIKDEREGKKEKQVISFIEAYKKQKMKRALRIIRKPNSAIHKISFQNTKLKKWIHPNRRSGRPRLSWTEETIKEIWEHIKQTNDRFKYTAFNENNEEHITQIKQIAEESRTDGEQDS